jgi:hypothetical protein
MNRRTREEEKMLKEEEKQEEEGRIRLEFQALGQHFRLQLSPLPLPLAANSSFLMRRFTRF